MLYWPYCAAVAAAVVVLLSWQSSAGSGSAGSAGDVNGFLIPLLSYLSHCVVIGSCGMMTQYDCRHGNQVSRSCQSGRDE